MVDAHSKWPEVVEMQTTTAEKTIQVMRGMFAAYGLPEQVVSDNGPQFTSQEFAEFMKRNGIKHIKSTPYHPSTNGLAERFVQTFKRAMSKDFGSRPTHHQLANFLLVYRSSPHSTTNRTPSELFLKRQLRTRMDLLRPDSQVQTRVSERQGSQKLNHDRCSVQREYHVGETVMARNYRDGPKWMEGVVVERKSPLSYVVQVNHGMLWRRHIDQLRNGPSTAQRTDSDVEVPTGPEPEERERKSKHQRQRVVEGSVNHQTMLKRATQRLLVSQRLLESTPPDLAIPLRGTSELNLIFIVYCCFCITFFFKWRGMWCIM